MSLYYERNLQLLERRFPKALEYLKVHNSDEGVATADTRSGTPTLFVRGERADEYIHSKYDPMNEAEKLLTGIEEQLENVQHVLFYGVGMGYHIELFIAKHPEVPCTIYEPNTNVFQKAMKYKSLEKILKNNMRELFVGQHAEEYANYFLQNVHTNPLIYVLPSYERVYKDELMIFLEAFKTALSFRKVQVQTNYGFEQLWTVNSELNLPHVLKTPNFIRDMHLHFVGKPIILAAAGPSLNEEFEHLKYVKEHGLAYIFAVGSANKAFIAQGFYPDAVLSYDPNQYNHIVYQEIIEQNIDSIPLIYGSTVGYETLERYPGPKMHFITSQDSVTPYFLSDYDFQNELIADAPSIAVLTLEIIKKLQCSMVILVGQNFAYKNGRYYTEGIDYGELRETQEETVYTESVDGNLVATIEAHNLSRRQMEHCISTMENIEVINTTKGGANINGSKYVPLIQVVHEKLTKKIVVPEWWLKSGNNYNKQQLKFKSKSIRKNHDQLDEMIIQIGKDLQRLQQAVNKKNINLVVSMINKISNANKDLYKNRYYQIFIKPMVRSANMIFQQTIKDMTVDTDVYVRGDRIVNSFGPFLLTCQQVMHVNEYYFNRMLRDINALEMSK